MKKDTETDNDWVKSLKEHTRKNPLKKNRKNVRQRSKRSPITVEGSFSTCPHKTKNKTIQNISLHSELSGVKLKVTATPEAWKKIESFIIDHPEWFGLEFHACFAQPAVLRINERNRPRGRQKRIQHFATDVKIAAGALYAILSYWCKRPVKEWPEYFKRIITSAKKEGHEDYLKPEGRHAPKELTAYIIDKTYGGDAKQVGLKSFFEYDERDSLDNFYVTYIHADRRPARITASFIRNRTQEEVEQLAYTMPALNNIFEILQVL